MSNRLTPEEMAFTQSAGKDECLNIIDELAAIYIKIVDEQSSGEDLGENKTKCPVKQFSIANAIVWRLCNEDEAEPLFKHYVKVVKNYMTEFIIVKVEQMEKFSAEFL